MTDEDAERFEDYIISDDQQQILDQLKDPIPVPIPAQKTSQISNAVHNQPSTPNAAGRAVSVLVTKPVEKDTAFVVTAAVAATLVSLGTAVVTSPTKKAASSYPNASIGNHDMSLTQTESSHTQNLHSLLSNETDPNTQIDETLREAIIDNVDDVDPSAGFELQAVDTSMDDASIVDTIHTEVVGKETPTSATRKKRFRPVIILRRSNRIINAESWKNPISNADASTSPKRQKLSSEQNPDPAVFMNVERVLDNQPNVDGAADLVAISTPRATDTTPVKIEELIVVVPEIEMERSGGHATSKEDEDNGALDIDEDEGQRSSKWLTQPMTQDMFHGSEEPPVGSEESLVYSSQSEIQQPCTQASFASPLELSCHNPRNKPSNLSRSEKEERKKKHTESTLGRIMPPDAEFDPYYLNKKISKLFGGYGIFKGKVLHYSG